MTIILTCTLLILSACTLIAGLSSSFYNISCPNLASVVEEVVRDAVLDEPRMAASLLRLHFHDCLVEGCDGSVLLDDTPKMVGEKTSPSNKNSIRGFDVIDKIKAAVETACPATVSCADILALAANASVRLVGGSTWEVLLGRTDSRTASYENAMEYLPAAVESLDTIFRKFAVWGLSPKDTIVLSGAHTIGRASCTNFDYRLYNFSGTNSYDPSMDSDYQAFLSLHCCAFGASSTNRSETLSDLDVSTPDWFDNKYYTNLVQHKGLLESDQELYPLPNVHEKHVELYSHIPELYDVASLVRFYSSNESAFFEDFNTAMIKLGNISPSSRGEIRKNCRKVN